VEKDDNEILDHNFGNDDNDLAAFDSARYSQQSIPQGDGIVEDVDFS
jgi:hypothetical protein